MDPAEKAGNRERWGQARLTGFWDGDPRPARVLIHPCPSFSPVLMPPAWNVPGLQETRGQEKPQSS